MFNSVAQDGNPQSNRDTALVERAKASRATANLLDTLYEPVTEGSAFAAGVGRRRVSLTTLWRFKWLALAVFLGVSIPAIAGVWLIFVPLYSATAQVEVSPRIPRLLYRTDENGAIPFYDQYLQVQSQAIRSPQLLNRVLTKISDSTWFKRPSGFTLGSPPSPMDRLRDNLKVNANRRSSLIHLTMTARDPNDAALVLNSVVDEYLQYVANRARQQGAWKNDELLQRFNELRSKIDGFKEQIQTTRGDLLATTPDELLTRQRLRLEEKLEAVEDLKMDFKLTEWEHDELSNLTPPPGTSEGGAEDVRPAVTRYIGDLEYRGYARDLKEAEHRIEIEGETLGERNPKMIELRRTREYARANMEERARELDEMFQLLPGDILGAPAQPGGVAAQLKDLAFKLKRLEFTLLLAEKAAADERARVGQTSDNARALERQLDELAFLKQQFEAVREKKLVREIESVAPASIHVLSRALPPSQPTNGRRPLALTLLALIGGVACAAGAAYLRAITIPAVQEASDLCGPLRAPFLGHVLLPQPTGVDGPEIEAIQAECVRMVRTALLQRIDEHGGSAIQITSAGPGAGKTTIAVMLAKSLARCGRKVLLVDADLRNPNIGERCGVSPEPGLIGILTAGVADADAVHAGNEPGMSVLPAGKYQGNGDVELLANGVLAECLTRWRREYDLVLIDSPPLLPVADARILARQTDGNVLVVREGQCRRADVIEALEQLEVCGGSLIGVVFQSSRRQNRYHGRSYDYHTGGHEASSSAMDAGKG